MQVSSFLPSFLFSFLPLEKVSLYNPSWPRTCNCSAASFQVLRIQVCITMQDFTNFKFSSSILSTHLLFIHPSFPKGHYLIFCDTYIINTSLFSAPCMWRQGGDYASKKKREKIFLRCGFSILV
jgi:hypothetical protein